LITTLNNFKLCILFKYTWAHSELNPRQSRQASANLEDPNHCRVYSQTTTKLSDKNNNIFRKILNAWKLSK
jgi:hypothetical protein